MLRKPLIIETVFDQLKTYLKSSILGTVIVSTVWSTCWLGSSHKEACRIFVTDGRDIYQGKRSVEVLPFGC
uniref:hypothetical protein n=1 Tax=Candidatus Enterovibrio escicola TaxID=1927127 RepID=UPI0016817240